MPIGVTPALSFRGSLGFGGSVSSAMVFLHVEVDGPFSGFPDRDQRLDQQFFDCTLTLAGPHGRQTVTSHQRRSSPKISSRNGSSITCARPTRTSSAGTRPIGR